MIEEVLRRRSAWMANRDRRPATLLLPPSRFEEFFAALPPFCSGDRVFGMRVEVNCFDAIDFA